MWDIMGARLGQPVTNKFNYGFNFSCSINLINSGAFGLSIRYLIILVSENISHHMFESRRK
jgi:hypothetical protein